jgi:hypothetical protein
MLRYYWLPINHYLLHLVGFSFTYLSRMHGHSDIKSIFCYFSPHNSRCIWFKQNYEADNHNGNEQI